MPSLRNRKDLTLTLSLELPGWLTQLGLARQLSPSRRNGLHAVLKPMQQLLEAADQGVINH